MASYNNQVIGSRSSDNKDPKNKAKAQGSSMHGIAPAHNSPTIKSVQNSKNQTPSGPDQSGDEGIKTAAKRAKKIIRKDTSFTDGAIKMAQNMRGERYLRGK